MTALPCILAFAFGVVCGGLGLMVWWPWLDAVTPEPDDELASYPETQDDFSTSVARWGYLHDRRS